MSSAIFSLPLLYVKLNITFGHVKTSYEFILVFGSFFVSELKVSFPVARKSVKRRAIVAGVVVGSDVVEI